MIPCTECCKYQKNGECTYNIVSSKLILPQASYCAYFEKIP